MKHKQTTLFVRSFDEAKAREFYCEFLGFTVTHTHRFAPDLPLFMTVERDGMKLYLSEHHGDAAPGAHVVFIVEGLREFHQELTEKAYKYARPGLEPFVAGGMHVTVGDPFGNRLTFWDEKA